MLRISQVGLSGGAAVLRLEGRIVGPWVAEVRRCCEDLLAEGRPVTLDLEEVTFADRDGVLLLHALIRRRVQFLNCSLFLGEQVKLASPQESHADTRAGDHGTDGKL